MIGSLAGESSLLTQLFLQVQFQLGLLPQLLLARRLRSFDHPVFGNFSTVPLFRAEPAPSTSNVWQEVSSRGYNQFFVPPASSLSVFPSLIPPVVSEPPVPFCPAGSVSSLELSVFPAFSHHLIPTLTCPPFPEASN